MNLQTIDFTTVRWPDLKTAQPLWFQAAMCNFVLMGTSLILSGVDARELHDISVWSKPFKFGLAIGVYFLTLAWFSQFIPTSVFATRAGRYLVGIPLFAGMGEMLYIFAMAGLGQPSHFNYSTGFTSFMYALMGIGAMAMVLVLPWMSYYIGKHNPLTHPVVLAIVVGLALTCVLGGGFGGYLSANNGHWVNAAATDAGGMQFFNWTRDGGDLRVAHFFGMHAMHAFPLFALCMPRRWNPHLKLSLLIAFISAYSAFTMMTFIQALQGRPFIG